MRWRGIAPIALILVGTVACTSSGSGGETAGPTSAVPATSTASSTPTAPSTSPTPTPSVATTGPNVRPGEKPPTLGSLGKINTAAGADAFAHYWIDTIDWAYATMNSSLPRTAFLPTCQQCAHFLSFDIDQVAAKGEHYVGGRLATNRSEVQANDGHAGATSVIDLQVSQAPFRILASSGTIVDQATATRTVTFRTWLKWNGQEWKIADWKTAILK